MNAEVVYLERVRSRRRAQAFARAYRALACRLPPGDFYRDLVAWVAENFSREAATPDTGRDEPV
jgi:hypothetical protein